MVFNIFKTAFLNDKKRVKFFTMKVLRWYETSFLVNKECLALREDLKKFKITEKKENDFIWTIYMEKANK